MTIQQAKKLARLNTLGCWWPSRAYPHPPIWPEIINELEGSAELAIEYRNDTAEAGSLRTIAAVLRKAVSDA